MAEQPQEQSQEQQQRVRIALENPSGTSQGSSTDDAMHTDQHIRWDEATIEEHDKLRGTRQKINEPDTPYNFDSQSDISDCESADSRGGSIIAVSPAAPGRTPAGGGQAALEGVIKAVKVRLPTADQLDKERTARWEDDEQGGSGGQDQDRFKQKRAQHYNEFHMMRQWRQRHSVDEDDPTEEAHANGHCNGNGGSSSSGGGGGSPQTNVGPRA
eukprot:TRINITY_DN1649_c0_g2_i1.p2 TRINITY_DN1649_c0_g2~~TRINITY_DN1649_c0_g2_i1.p2  ORF type:complete len:248 (+),score=92.84 TRINITY_DN1649_c0_g2_i1:104-745(+)